MTLQSPFKRLHNRMRFGAAHLFRQRTLSVSGRWGDVTGFADDEVMLCHYGRCGTWSIAVVDALEHAAMEAQKSGRPALFVDVGASIGLVTIGLLRGVPLQAVALEPDVEAHALLMGNLEAQDFADRVRVLRVAAGAPKEAGQHVAMQRYPGNGGDIRICGETSNRAKAPLVNLDSLLEEEASPLLLKIDVQGYEPGVVAGGLQSLRRAALSVVEFWPHGLQCYGHDPMDFARRLLADNAAVALIENEHRPQQPEWIERDEALYRLGQYIEAKNPPERQLEILMRPAG